MYGHPVDGASSRPGTDPRTGTAHMQVVTIETPELGDRSYVVGEGGPGGEALVIDPQRDLDRVEAVLAERGWTCVLVRPGAPGPPEHLAHAQFHSARRLAHHPAGAAVHPPRLRLDVLGRAVERCGRQHPRHGGPQQRRAHDRRRGRRRRPARTGQTPCPAYQAHLGPPNTAGPTCADLPPPHSRSGRWPAAVGHPSRRADRPGPASCPEASPGVDDRARTVDPEALTTATGSVLGDDFLVVCPGIQLD